MAVQWRLVAMTRVYETELQRHPGIAQFERRTAEKVLDLINGCDRGEHDFSLLDQDPEALSCFRAIIWGPFVVPPPQPSAGNPNRRLPAVSQVEKELCPRSFDAASQHPAENNGVLVTTQGKRGPKFHKTPDDIIKELALSHHFGARRITAELERRGLQVNLRTVTRRLSAIHSQELPLFKN
jgi:hypothetical protein